jgi:hypothetical protein
LLVSALDRDDGEMRLRTCFSAMALAACLSAGAAAAPAKPRPDLADIAQGVYYGDVISDARGSSRSDVTITVTKTAPMTVQVSSDYPRLKTFTARLTRAMQTIQNAGGSEVFLLDLAKSPPRLDVTVDDASWSGSKAPAPQ